MVPLPSGLTVANSVSSPFHRTLLEWSWDPGAGRACLLMTAAGGEGLDSRKGLLFLHEGSGRWLTSSLSSGVRVIGPHSPCFVLFPDTDVWLWLCGPGRAQPGHPRWFPHHQPGLWLRRDPRHPYCWPGLWYLPPMVFSGMVMNTNGDGPSLLLLKPLPSPAYSIYLKLVLPTAQLFNLSVSGCPAGSIQSS